MKLKYIFWIIVGTCIFFGIANKFVYSEENIIQPGQFSKKTESVVKVEKEVESIEFKCLNKKCGLRIEEEDNFCSTCGTKLNKKGRNAIIIKKLMVKTKELDGLIKKRIELEKEYIEGYGKSVDEKIQKQKSIIKTLEENLRLPEGVEYGTEVWVGEDGNLVIKTPASAYPSDSEHQKTLNTKNPLW